MSNPWRGLGSRLAVLAAIAVLGACASEGEPGGRPDVWTDSGADQSAVRDAARDAAADAAGDVFDEISGDATSPIADADGSSGWPASRPPLTAPEDPYRAWILLDGNVDAAIRTLDAAVARGATTVQLSHGLIMAPEDVLEDGERLTRLNTVVAAAKERGLQVLLWSHEIEGQVSLNVCFDPADPIWERRREAYRALLDAVPGVDGVVLMYGSSNVSPWFALCDCDWCESRAPSDDPYDMWFRTPPPAERVAWVTRVVSDVVEGERGKRLLVRTFIHQPLELDAVGDGLELAADVPFRPMSKDVPQDWQPYYPLNPLFGRFPDRGHVVEMDAAGEYWGQSVIPFAAVDYVHRRLLNAMERGAVGFAVRVERGSHSALGTPNELNIYAADRLFADPSEGPEKLAEDWVVERYGLAAGGDAAVTLARILRRTEAIGRRTFYNLGFWALEKGSEPPERCRQPALLHERTVAKWDADPAWADLEAQLTTPTPAVLASLAQEKHEAAALAATNLAELESISPKLAPADATDLHHRLTLQAAAVDAWAAVTEVVWGYRLWAETGDDEDASSLEAALERLEAIATDIPTRIDGDPWPVSTDRLRACAEDVRGAFPDGVVPVARTQPFLSPPALERCGADLCVTVTATEPVHLGLRFGWHLPQPKVEIDGPEEAATSWVFRVPRLPAGRWAVLRAEAGWAEGTLLGGDTWLWPDEVWPER